MNNTGLYIHIPFCQSKCPYCDFYSVTVNDELKYQYKNAVLRNLLQYKNLRYDTVYFGGGTPILLWKEICEILEKIGCQIDTDAEITLEANPCCTTHQAICSLKSFGVNRISFGLQSSKDNELKALGRWHTSKEGQDAVISAYNAGIENISGDIMLGIPQQTENSLNDTLAYMCDLPLTHISAYMLKIEENTPFSKANICLPSDEQFSDFYMKTVNYLSDSGFSQYEISNFSKQGFESRHNLKYWRCEEYIGIGPSAHSFYNSKRFATDRNLDKFIYSQLQEAIITDDSPAGFDEWVMLKLRLTEGLDFNTALKRYGISKEKILNKLKLIPEQYYNVDSDSLWLTPDGFMISNAVIGIITDI